MASRPVVEGTLRYKLAQWILRLLYGRNPNKFYYIAPWQHLSCGTGVAIIHRGKALIAKRSMDMQYYPGKYASVGGYLKPRVDTSVIRGLLREIQEETGLVLSEGRITFKDNLLNVRNFPNKTTPDQSTHHHMTFQFVIELTDDEVAQMSALDETDSLHWLTFDELTALFESGEFAYDYDYDMYRLAFAWSAQ